MTPRPRVALMIETLTVYGRNLLQGITRYLRRTDRGRSSWSSGRLTRSPPAGSGPGRETA